MNTKMKWKIAIDVMMSVMLLLLMAYQVTGELLHEVFGTVMLVLFLIHHVLNIRWYKNLAKGRYTAPRIIMTVTDAALFLAMISLAYSGIVMSRYVFVFLPGRNGMALARVMHLAASYWGFVLMSIHIGFHWGMVTGLFGRNWGTRSVQTDGAGSTENGETASMGKKRAGFAWAARLAAAVIALYGAVCFYQADILSYLLLKAEFAFFDYEESMWIVFARLMAMMGFWIFISYYALRLIGRCRAGNRKKKQ